MTGCCDPGRYDDVFGDGFARRRARRYRGRGLDRTAARLVDFVAAEGLAGARVLEIGGGLGEVGLELLKRGASSAVCVELSSGYDEEARRLADEAGVADRVERRIVDLVADPTAVEPADVVVLHRVVCCYPDHELLLGTAAEHCRDRLAFSHPPRHLASRAVVGTQNALLRLGGREFRGYTHPPAAMLAVLGEHGLQPQMAHEGALWHARGLVRVA